jgi:hypothetical protein
MLFAAILFAIKTSDADLSRRLTSEAEELLKLEKKVAAAENGLDAVLYEDVLALLDAALHASPQNLHARVVSSDVLLLKAKDSDGTYDVCTLLDARDEAEFVTSRASRASGRSRDRCPSTRR